MSLNRATTINVSEEFLVSQKTKKGNKPKWTVLVDEVNEERLVGITCNAYSTEDRNTDNNTKVCACGRLTRSHSFVGSPTRQKDNDSFNQEFTTECALTVYGQLANKAKFIRCDQHQENAIRALCELIRRDVDKKPVLLISCFGGAQYFTMTDKLEKEFMNGISQAALTEGISVLCNSKQLFESLSVRRYRLLKAKPSKPILIGLTAWGTVTEHTRDALKLQASIDNESVYSMSVIGKQAFLTLKYDDETKTLDKNHSHFLLLDNGSVNNYLDDSPRSEFVEHACNEYQCQTLTLLVEGGFNSLEVIENDLQMKRPVVIINGSGRMANVLGTLFETTSKGAIPEESNVEKQLEIFFREKWSEEKKQYGDEVSTYIDRIKIFFEKEYRQYISVFNLERDPSLTDIIFKAVDSAQTAKEEQDKPLSETTAPQQDHSRAEANKKQKENYLKLAISWNYADRAETMPKRLEDDPSLYPRFFEQALKENRPVFVDYFLRRNHNPLLTTKFLMHSKEIMRNGNELDSSQTTTQSKQTLAKSATNLVQKVQVNYALAFVINELYASVESNFDHQSNPKTLEELERIYTRMIGPFAQSFYFNRSRTEQLWLNVQSMVDRFCSREIHATLSRADVNDVLSEVTYTGNKSFGSREMLRELFLWSVYAGYADIAFVLLLQLESRMTAALIATEIAQRLSSSASTLDIRHKYSVQAGRYEVYATDCINLCYEYNERRACQLLLRENPLFGNVTCMQVAVASRIMKFINTDCFNQVLDREWFGHLPSAAIESSAGKFKFLVSLMTLGLIKQRLRKYLPTDEDETSPKLQQTRTDMHEGNCDRWQGIDDYTIESPTFLQKTLYFHSAPVVKICYDFVIYVWFLLVFSYMMLFRMNMDQNPAHWTKIYLIIAVSAMLIEDIRKLIADYYTRMMERWHRIGMWWVAVYATPYILFYIGIILCFRSQNQPKLLTAARVILAIDLEIWFLFSLRFASAIKLLGPKLFMIRNMLRYLTAFMCIIFVGVAAYGVVSRSLTMYNQIEFTAESILSAVFYQPYWFLYSIVDQELATLDGIISNATSSEALVGATVTHVLLAFHMLFVNILILNLLIAIFNLAINEVQEKNEYVWRYQRYELIREYFEKPLFAFPPLSLLAYVGWFINAVILRGTTFRVFKLRCTSHEMDIEWTDFENAASYEYTRKLVDNKYRSNTEDKVSTAQLQINAMKKSIDGLHAQIKALNYRSNSQSQVSIQTAANEPVDDVEKLHYNRDVLSVRAEAETIDI